MNKSKAKRFFGSQLTNFKYMVPEIFNKEEGCKISDPKHRNSHPKLPDHRFKPLISSKGDKQTRTPKEKGPPIDSGGIKKRNIVVVVVIPDPKESHQAGNKKLHNHLSMFLFWVHWFLLGYLIFMSGRSTSGNNKRIFR